MGFSRIDTVQIRFRLSLRLRVLDDGRLVEHGTHDELLAAGGRYTDPYRIPAAAYATA